MDTKELYVIVRNDGAFDKLTHFFNCRKQAEEVLQTERALTSSLRISYEIRTLPINLDLLSEPEPIYEMDGKSLAVGQNVYSTAFGHGRVINLIPEKTDTHNVGNKSCFTIVVDFVTPNGSRLHISFNEFGGMVDTYGARVLYWDAEDSIKAG